MWDTSDPYGAHYNDDKKQSWTVGAVRDPARWSDWPDVVMLVSIP